MHFEKIVRLRDVSSEVKEGTHQYGGFDFGGMHLGSAARTDKLTDVAQGGGFRLPVTAAKGHQYHHVQSTAFSLRIHHHMCILDYGLSRTDQ